MFLLIQSISKHPKYLARWFQHSSLILHSNDDLCYMWTISPNMKFESKCLKRVHVTCLAELRNRIFLQICGIFLRKVWGKTRYLFLRETSPGATGCTGNFAGARRAALESSRFRRCTHGRRAMAAQKPMCRYLARQCHGTGESRNLSFKFKLRVITLKWSVFRR